ncbi:54S ribosomal protein L12, mitochondrial [Entomophthora muscae]|uniref:54S ribosomal protein L12, mitochondrial n=1 Tax=Entomophthora muscae TaxID=34485 RepID=A0ACC2TZ62_9FUNG|nr:54S ribosomal protein L12, mitochondrial [Entomophthora muscae]
MTAALRFVQTVSRNVSRSRVAFQGVRFYTASTDAPKASIPTENLPTSAKIAPIVEQIAGLTLLETSELIEALKVKLNISEIAMPAASAAPVAAAAPAEEAPAEKPAEKTMFTVKLEKFDAAAKAKVIREIKAILPGANLVEAKKFVESAPKVIRSDVPKEEAEKLKATLEAVGATVVLE